MRMSLEEIQQVVATLKSSDRSKLTNLRSEIAVGLNEADAGDFVSFTSEEIIREGRTRRSQPPLDNPSEVR